MANYYCKNCGEKFQSIRNLTSLPCRRSPFGTYKGKHELYEGTEKDFYTCKYCGDKFPTISALTSAMCRNSPEGRYKGRHIPSL